MKDQELLDLFESWHNTLQAHFPQQYRANHTPHSLLALYKLVKRFRPDAIVEIGTGFGLSTRALNLALGKGVLTTIEGSQYYWNRSREYLPVTEEQLKNMLILNLDPRGVDIPKCWEEYEKVLLFHSTHGLGPAKHVIEATKKLPRLSIVVVDNMWYSEETIDADTVEIFWFEQAVQHVDPKSPIRPRDYADYWEGGSWFGYSEINAVMAHVNTQQIQLQELKPKMAYWRIE